MRAPHVQREMLEIVSCHLPLRNAWSMPANASGMPPGPTMKRTANSFFGGRTNGRSARRRKREVLTYAVAFALRRSRKIVRGLKEGLTEDERYVVADHSVAQLKERGDPWRLNEEAPAAKPPST